VKGRRVVIWEYPTTDAATIHRYMDGCTVAGRAADAESFLRDDGKGALIFCSDDGAEPGGMPVVKKLQVVFTGGQYGREGGDWLFYVGLWTPDEFREEFLAWYKMEHLPILLECPLWNGCRFVEQKVEKGCQFYAMHQMSDRGALDSTERLRSRSTPWFKRLSAHGWFDGAFTRTLCRRLAA
jgi:hypothetical protein